MVHKTASAAAACALLLSAGAASGYALNAHKAICLDVLENLATGGGTVFGPFKPSAANKRLVLGARGAFLAGCGWPDAAPFLGNTDPSHSDGWDPVNQGHVLWKMAETNKEKSFVLGYFSHLAMDGNVHAFANTYSGKSVGGPNATKPLVWDTFKPKNFLAHLVAESWVNKYFVYTKKGKIAPPREFYKKMWLHPGSPIVRHYHNIVEAGKAGALATIFQRLLDHLNWAIDYHWQEYYTWSGHQKYYSGKSGFEARFKKWFAGWFADWHKRRTEKVEKVKDAWVESSTQLATMLFDSQLSFNRLWAGFRPFRKAMSSYLALDLQLIKWPDWLVAMKDAAKNAIDAALEPLKKMLISAIKRLFAKQIKQVKQVLRAAAQRGKRRVFSKKSEEHAKKFFAAVGLKPNSKSGGIDNASVRAKLHKYPFYRNAFLGVAAVLETPSNLAGLSSADFTNGFTCSAAFKKNRSAFLTKGDPMYDHQPEGCSKGTILNPRSARFDESATQYEAKHSKLALGSKGYSFRKIIGGIVKAFGESVKKAAGWAYKKVRGAVGRAYRSIRTKVVAAYESALSAVKSGVSNAYNTAKAGVSKAYDKVKSSVGSAYDKVKSSVGSAYDKVKSGARSYLNKARKSFGKVGSSIRSSASKARSYVSSKLKKAGGAIKSGASSVKSGLKKAGGAIKSGLKKLKFW